MYLPKQFVETDVQVLHALIGAHPLATWVVHTEGGLQANHIPFVLDPHRGKFGTLVGHIARANDLNKLCREPMDSLLIFQGSDAYISPSWYPSKQDHGKVVPTWNYAVVHAHGQARLVDDREWLLAQLAQLTEAHESGRTAPWQVEDAPADFIDGLLQAIVGVEIPITRLEGKWKVSQNRPHGERAGVVAGLLGEDQIGARDMATLVAQHGNNQASG